LFAQTLILAAHSCGVGTCLQAAITDYPDAVRRVLGLPKTMMLVLGISIGYPDTEASINSYHSQRISPDKFVRWYD
jgi:nitroreductase